MIARYLFAYQSTFSYLYDRLSGNYPTKIQYSFQPIATGSALLRGGVFFLKKKEALESTEGKKDIPFFLPATLNILHV